MDKKNTIHGVKLLNCPFCDGEVEYHPQEHHMNNFWNKHTIYCPKCDFRMEGTSALILLNKWNMRKTVENIIEEINKLECYEEIMTSPKHPFCAYKAETISKNSVIGIIKKNISTD